MTTKRGGRKYKDAEITDNFNQEKLGVTKADITKAKRMIAAQKKLNAKPAVVKRTPKKKPPKTQDTNVNQPVSVMGYDDDGWPIFKSAAAGAEGTSELPSAPDPDEEDDEVSAQRMLADMRQVYKNLGGRKKLQELMAGDKEFMGMIKELMKAEISVITNKLKGRDGGSKQGFFVILKGLETEKPIVKAIEENKAINLRQIEKAINPTEYQMDQEEEEQDQSGGPGEIVKKAETVESVEGW